MLVHVGTTALLLIARRAAVTRRAGGCTGVITQVITLLPGLPLLLGAQLTRLLTHGALRAPTVNLQTHTHGHICVCAHARGHH